MPSPSTNEEIGKEAARIEEASKYSAQTQFSSSKTWRSLNLALGVPSAGLAAAAGTTGLADVAGATTVAILALAAAVLIAIQTTLNAAQRAEQSRVSANTYLALQSDARILRTIDLDTLSYEEARNELGELRQRQKDTNDQAPVPSILAYQLGKRNLTKGRQDYEVDR